MHIRGSINRMQQQHLLCYEKEEKLDTGNIGLDLGLPCVCDLAMAMATRWLERKAKEDLIDQERHQLT